VFLHKSILEFIARLKHAGSHCLTNTNGTLLNKKIIDELIKTKFDDLRITILAGTPEMYVRTHPGTSKDTFLKLKENLLYLSEKKAKLNLKYPRVTMIFIVLSQNVEGIFDFAKFAVNVGAQQIWYRPVDDVGDSGLANLVPTEDQADFARKELVKVKEYLYTKGITHNIDKFLKVFGTQLDTTVIYQHIPCYYGWLCVHIEPEGDVYPCCRCYEPLGNVYKSNFKDIWNGEKYRDFRKKARALHIRKTPVDCCDCNSCVNYIANLRVHKALHPFKGQMSQLIPCSST